MRNHAFQINLLLVFATFASVSQTPAQFDRARWITPPENSARPFAAPLLRQEFSLTAKPASATLRIIGLGDYEVHINGAPLTETGINQPWSQYEKTLYYRDFDVSQCARSGSQLPGGPADQLLLEQPQSPSGPLQQGWPPASCRGTVSVVRGNDCQVGRMGPSRRSARMKPGVLRKARSRFPTFSPERISMPVLSGPAGMRPGFESEKWQPVRLANTLPETRNCRLSFPSRPTNPKTRWR